MANSIEMASIDDEIPRILQTEKDEIEEGGKVDHSINKNPIFVGIRVPRPWTRSSAIRMAPMIPPTEKDEIEEGSKVDHIIDIRDTNGQYPSCTTFKVNVWLHESNPDAYTPKMVSIGPYHNKKPQLYPMEKYKRLYLHKFLGRRVGLDEESCISELETLKEKAINCYEDVQDDSQFCQMLLHDSQFCQMLLHDGCFVVEFIRECRGMWPKGEDKIINHNDVHIIRDLVLLENQLPFFILDKLHDMTKRDGESPLAMLAHTIWLPFFVDLAKPTDETILEITGGNIKHLLHLIHVISCLGNHVKKPEVEAGNNRDNDAQTWHMVMPNATELSEAGVSFAKSTAKTSIFDSIKFENGLMTIPWFRVTDNTETLLRNLIAYEQQSVDVEPKYFSNFAIFMDKLIESDKDVNLLCHKGIIENWLGDNKAVANLFNKIGNGVLVPDHDFYYKEQCRKAVEYCEKPWNRMKANLLRNYFSSPWVGASTVAAIVLLILTFIQTILSFISTVNM